MYLFGGGFFRDNIGPLEGRCGLYVATRLLLVAVANKRYMGSAAVYAWSGSIERHVGCEKDADVELVTITGGGHTWPGSQEQKTHICPRGPTPAQTQGRARPGEKIKGSLVNNSGLEGF